MDNNTPGSKETTAKDCTCPVIDNAHGRGHLGDGEKYGFWIDGQCPIHGGEALIETRKG